MTYEHYEREELASAAAGEAARQSNAARLALARRQFRQAVALALGQFNRTAAQCDPDYYDL